MQLALCAALVVLAVTLVAGALFGHADIIKAALSPGTSDPGKPGDQSSALFTGANTLASDALAILIPVVSLASAIGGIMWALGSQRGQGIVIGAMIAGVSVVMIKTIVA